MSKINSRTLFGSWTHGRGNALRDVTLLAELSQGASGTVHLSTTAPADRAVCQSFADYLTFSPPNGRLTDERFTEGGFTSELVQYFNGWADKDLERSMSYKTTGADLPVFRLSTGSSLVACTYIRSIGYQVSVRPARSASRRARTLTCCSAVAAGVAQCEGTQQHDRIDRGPDRERLTGHRPGV
ncbi:hypothetical protein ACFYW6_25795 [Streptomyces sp. NPDC002659]|uniref:hypothetical protein n=1 Tax=Streptomyces sp. NPDC002659 TaxID=3364656 RepID=UPI003687932A